MDDDYGQYRNVKRVHPRRDDPPKVYWLSQRLVCTCCDWRWDSQERYDDHLNYMLSIGMIEEDHA
jgi:hypothetical protein